MQIGIKGFRSLTGPGEKRFSIMHRICLFYKIGNSCTNIREIHPDVWETSFALVCLRNQSSTQTKFCSPENIRPTYSGLNYSAYKLCLQDKYESKKQFRYLIKKKSSLLVKWCEERHIVSVHWGDLYRSTQNCRSHNHGGYAPQDTPPLGRSHVEAGRLSFTNGFISL